MRGCRPLTDVEITTVHCHLSGRNQLRDRALFTLALKSGLRITSLLSLRIDDVWDGDVLGHFTVRKSTVKGRRAGFSHPMHPVAAAALKEFIEHRCIGLSGSAPLFRSGKGDAHGDLRSLDRTSAWRILKRAYRTAGLRGKTGCHSTRKSYAQKVYKALGHDLIATQQAMHLSSITSTIQYLSFDEEKVEAAILAI